jgi:hypothetical protein
MRRSLSWKTSIKFLVLFEHRSPHGLRKRGEIETWIAAGAELEKLAHSVFFFACVSIIE